MTERDDFIARFEQKKAAGLVDIKFFVKRREGLTSDAFMAAANRFDQAVKDGRCREHAAFAERLEQVDVRELLA